MIWSEVVGIDNDFIKLNHSYLRIISTINNNNMSNKTIKRIIKEKIAYHKNPLDSEGIFLYFDDNNLYKASALIIGPGDTPYEDGFYLFKFVFPDDYPHRPPVCKFYSTQGRSRMNPNLYESGKVCLSLLGTWSGPSWTSCHTLTSICMSIRALVLTSKPLQNEPSFAKVVGERSERYNRMLTHENLRIAVLLMMKNTPQGLKHFIPQMEEHFKKSFKSYIKCINNGLSLDEQHEKSPIWRMSVVYNYKFLYTRFMEMAKKLGFYEDVKSLKLIVKPVKLIVKPAQKMVKTKIPLTLKLQKFNDALKLKKFNEILKTQGIKAKDEVFLKLYSTMNNVGVADNALIKLINTELAKLPPKNTRRVPNGSASNFAEGFTKVSENNEQTYVIILDKLGRKRWRRIIEI